MSNHGYLTLFGVVVIITLAFIIPSVFQALTLCIVLIVLGSTILRLSSLVYTKKITKYPKADSSFSPFVSVHVACSSEPFGVVAKSLEHLSKLDYKNYEVVVFHNNNQNRDLEESIRKKCDELGAKFHFLHQDYVEGYKAGALDQVVKSMSSDTELMAIVDADYHVNPDFLKDCVGYFIDPKVAIVQTPQSYRNSEHSKGLSLEYRSFFSILMNKANNVGAVTFTGTMGILRADIIKEKKVAWNKYCITEDTEIGLQIHMLGYKAVYIDRAYGNGVMPFDYSSLRVQRLRWGYGNAQILTKYGKGILTSKSFHFLQRINLMNQLFAWLSPELVLAMLYLITSLLFVLNPNNREISDVAILSVICLMISLATYLTYFVVGFKVRKVTGLKDSFRAFLVHYGLLTTMSMSWMGLLLGQKLGFKITSKTRRKKGKKEVGYIQELLIPAILTVAVAIRLLTGQASQAETLAISTLVFLILFSVGYLQKQLKRFKSVSIRSEKK